MTMLDSTTTSTTAPQRLRQVSFDIYRDIHKGIRRELFSLVVDTGRIDPCNGLARVGVADRVQRTVQLLLEHAEHEDGAIQPVLEQHTPAFAAQIADDHHELDERMNHLLGLAEEARGTRDRRGAVHELYLELASFTSAYLGHIDLEERQVAQALDEAVGVEGLMAIHGAIVGGMPPEQLSAGLAVMLPAMNVDDRTEMLGGIKAHAPAEAFDGIWRLAQSVLTAEEHRAVGDRLGVR